MTDPLSLAAIAIAQSSPPAELPPPATPTVDLQRSQRVQAEKERLDQILRQMRQQVKPEARPPLESTAPVPPVTNPVQSLQPRSGSQLFAQRRAALQAGQVHTRLARDEFYPAWASAMQSPTRQQWRSLLVQEANQVRNAQEPIGILLGDSLSLWFPSDRLPPTRLWLNQAISGENTGDILHRLSTFGQTRPQIVYLMAGVNDLKQGATDQRILQNLRLIVQRLRQQHPQTRVVVQSILPPRSLPISSQRIARLNQQLRTLARQQGAYYLDVSARMVDPEGYLRADLTTDGLHLNANGYAVWQQVLHQSEQYLVSQSSR